MKLKTTKHVYKPKNKSDDMTPGKEYFTKEYGNKEFLKAYNNKLIWKTYYKSDFTEVAK